MTPDERRAAALSAFNNASGYEALSAHLNAMLGYVMDGQWWPGNGMIQRTAIELVEMMPEAELIALLPGGGFDALPFPYRPLMVLHRFQYLMSSHFVMRRCLGETPETYCTIAEWPSTEAVQVSIERTARWR